MPLRPWLPDCTPPPEMRGSGGSSQLHDLSVIVIRPQMGRKKSMDASDPTAFAPIVDEKTIVVWRVAYTGVTRVSNEV